MLTAVFVLPEEDFEAISLKKLLGELDDRFGKALGRFGFAAKTQPLMVGI